MISDLINELVRYRQFLSELEGLEDIEIHKNMNIYRILGKVSLESLIDAARVLKTIAK